MRPIYFRPALNRIRKRAPNKLSYFPFCNLQKMIGPYFIFNQAVNQPGKSVKIVAYPKWRFACITFFDLQINFCCVPRNSLSNSHSKTRT